MSEPVDEVPSGQPDEPAYRHRWVAGPGAAADAARAFTRVQVRKRGLWVCLALIWVCFSALFALSFAEPIGGTGRVVWGALYGLLPTAIVLGFLLGVAYVANRRRFAPVLAEGVVLEGQVDEAAVRLRSPRGQHVLLFTGLAEVQAQGEWVLLRQQGSPVFGLWPRALFPDEDLARLIAATTG